MIKRLLYVMAAAMALQASAIAQTTKLRVSTIPIIDTAPLQVAISKGFFTAEGLEIDTTPTQGGAVGLPALAAGQVQIAFSNIVSIALGVKQNLGFQIITPGAGTGDAPPDSAGVMVKSGSPIKTGKDLEAKRLAVNTRNNVIWLFARAWVQSAGGDPDKVTYLEVPFPQMVDALRGDRVDAIFVVEPFHSAGIKAGAHNIGYPYSAFAKRLPIGMYASTESYIKANPQVIEKFTRAYLKGVEWNNQNKGSEEWMNIVSAYTRIPPDQLKGLPVPPWERSLDAASIDKVTELMVKHKMIDAKPDAKAMLYRTAVTPPK